MQHTTEQDHTTTTSRRGAARRRLGVLALGTALAASALGLGSAPAATAAPAKPAKPAKPVAGRTLPVSTVEKGCVQTSVLGGVVNSEILPLVPSRYTPTRVNGPGFIGSYVRVWDYTCSSISVDGQAPRRASVTLVGVQLSQRDGQPTTGHYLLALGTDDAGLAKRYRLAGLPDVSSTDVAHAVTTTAEATTASWDVTGGLPHTASATAPALPTATAASGTGLQFYSAAARGREVSLSYDNLTLGTASATTAYDLSRLPQVGSLIQVPVTDSSPGTLSTGSWKVRAITR